MAILSFCLLGRCSCESAELFPLILVGGRSTRYSNKLHDFSETITRSYKNVNINSFSLATAFLWNSLPDYCFPLRMI